MVLRRTARKTGKLFAWLATGAICLNPAHAQQTEPRVEAANEAAEGPSSPLIADKEVTLAADGSFRAAVLTRSGRLVPKARMTFASQQPKLESAVQASTGAAGLTVVSGFKAGLYRVRVESPEGVYDGTLRIKTSAIVQASFLPAPLVAFTLAPAQANCPREDDDPDGGRAGALGLVPTDLGRRGLLLAGLAGGATAIALPLALEGGRRPARRASP